MPKGLTDTSFWKGVVLIKDVVDPITEKIRRGPMEMTLM